MSWARAETPQPGSPSRRRPDFCERRSTGPARGRNKTYFTFLCYVSGLLTPSGPPAVIVLQAPRPCCAPPAHGPPSHPTNLAAGAQGGPLTLELRRFLSPCCHSLSQLRVACGRRRVFRTYLLARERHDQAELLASPGWYCRDPPASPCARQHPSPKLVMANSCQGLPFLCA